MTRHRAAHTRSLAPADSESDPSPSLLGPNTIAQADDTVDPTPILNAPEPKRRFIPSKWEEKK
jgi:hypothetical protein